MTDSPVTARRLGTPFRPGRARLRGGMAALLLIAAAGFAGCSGGARDSESRRRDGDERAARRSVGEPPVDTSSLLTPTRVDSLVGAARGVGGEASLATTCATCHEGEHAAPLGRDAAASATCAACHATSHAAIQALYAGTVRGANVPADTMFLSRVSCVGCHTDTTFASPPGGARVAALDAMCTSCHGSRFAGMLAMWQQGTQWRAQLVTAYVNQAARDPRLAGGDARTRVRDARQWLDLLRVAGAVHNVRGTDRLLRAALDSTASAYRRAGVAPPARPALGPDPSANACLGCHYGIEASTLGVRDETFSHGAHVLRGNLACRECHSDATYFKDAGPAVATADKALDPRHGRTTLTPASCSGCHHSPTAQLPCATCHATDERLERPVRVIMALSMMTSKSPINRPVAFQHAQHATAQCTACHRTPGDARQVATCASCHADHHKERAAGCTACHGTTLMSTHAMDTHFKCAECHTRETVARLDGDRSFCLSCHVKQVNHEPARECAPCHLHLTPAQVRDRMRGVPTTPARPR